MKSRVDFINGQDTDFARQKCIGSPQDGLPLHRANRLNVGNLPMRVNTGVCAAGTEDVHFMIEELLKSFLKLALNGTKIRLDLPSMEIRAVIGKSQLEVPHSIGYSMWIGVSAMPPITATIITFNEEDRIVECLASLSCCDEVIVVDSGSTDKTRELARARGVRVLERVWEGYSKQKNFAADQARNDWILSIDADERLSMELANEIVRWKKEDPSNHQSIWAFSMPRRVFYLGRWIKHSGWYPDRKVRLYDRRHCRWEGDFVHESMKVDGKAGGFQSDLLHFPYRDWRDHVARIARYTELAAKGAHSGGRRGSVGRLVLGPPLSFIKSFFLHVGFLDGWRGLAIAYMGARYIFEKEFRILASGPPSI
jgi:glycosyltransferase involved in cell wall biosynthesis